MSDKRRRYRAVRAKLKKLYPFEPTGNLARHLNTLAYLISGIVGSKHVNLRLVAEQVPDGDLAGAYEWLVLSGKAFADWLSRAWRKFQPYRCDAEIWNECRI